LQYYAVEGIFSIETTFLLALIKDDFSLDCQQNFHQQIVVKAIKFNRQTAFFFIDVKQLFLFVIKE
jgi:hypothetical protein